MQKNHPFTDDDHIVGKSQDLCGTCVQPVAKLLVTYQGLVILKIKTFTSQNIISTFDKFYNPLIEYDKFYN